jgi:hypothetical protein
MFMPTHFDIMFDERRWHSQRPFRFFPDKAARLWHAGNILMSAAGAAGATKRLAQ